MESVYKIKDLNKLLQMFLGPGVQILEYSLKPLISAGENYGSEMLALDLKFKNKEEEEETLNLVAKLCPPNEYLRELFDSSVTFKKEIAVYTKIFPTLIDFQKEQGMTDVIDFFPRCYGARIDSNLDSIADDAVLLLENLKNVGFRCEDRMKGFDLETARLLLKNLAVFHAVPLAIKLLKSDVFDNQIRTHLNRNTIFDCLSENGLKMEVELVTKTAKLESKCEVLIPSLIKLMVNGLKSFKTPERVNEPFGTINHNDYWVNNTMIKFENGKPVVNKMLDFQLVDYGSPANDFVFFLFTSVQSRILENNYNELVKYYFDNFLNVLIRLGCNVEPFTLELFEEEIKKAAITREFFHSIVMLRHVFAVKGVAKELNEVEESDLTSEEAVSEECRQRIIQIILHFDKMKWI